MGTYLNELYARNASLQCENKALRQQVDEFKNGRRYKILQDGHNRIVAGYKRENRRLARELAAAREETIRVRNIWFEQCEADFDSYQKEMEKKAKRISTLEEKYWETIRDYDRKLLEVQEQYIGELKEKDEEIAKKDAIIQELTARLAHAEALQNRDGTNTGTPTSQTPYGKEKRVPNSRKSSGKPKGGQDGHVQSTLDAPGEEEVTDEVVYSLEDTAKCPTCGSGDLVYSGEYEDHFVYEVEINVKKQRHRYYLYLCQLCGATIKSTEGPDFRSKCQYGPNVQAIALSLTNTVNASMNKAGLLLAGITNNEINPCDGYIAKLQQRAAKGLIQFYADLRLKVITLSLLYWDDTVIFINTKRACFRFYGDESIAFYTAHMKKDLEGLMEDNVLPLLTSDTKVMHDHNTVNYNEAFHFQNLECNQHLERDCQKNADDTKHEWSADLKKHIASTIHDRNIAKEAMETCFAPDYIVDFYARLDEILKHGRKEYEADKVRLEKYGASFEQALLNRIEEYRDNYFPWVSDFSLPTTNNLSERSLRPVKSKMKISGQFESEAAAQNYAAIRSYIETCRRKGKNEIEALRRLCEGNPYTVEELFS